MSLKRGVFLALACVMVAVSGGPGASVAASQDAWDPGNGPWVPVPRDRVAEECGLDPDVLDRANIRFAANPFVVVRYGKLCWEGGNLPGRTTSTQYGVASVTKTIGAVMVGLVTTRVPDFSDEDLVTKWIAPSQLSGINPEATIAHVLAMTSTKSNLDYGSKGVWSYDINGGREINRLVQIMNIVMRQHQNLFPEIQNWAASANPANQLFAHVFGEKLGMTSSSWVGNGIGSEARSTPLDLARMGLLMLRRGVYNNERLMDEEYVYRMQHPAFRDTNTGYGYLTQLNALANWVYSTGTNHPECAPLALWPEYPHRPFYEGPNNSNLGSLDDSPRYDVGVTWASGAGGQRVIMHRGLDLVMTIRDDATNEGPRNMWNAIRPALVALDPTFQGNELEFCRAYADSEYAPDLLASLAAAQPTVTIDGNQATFSTEISNSGEAEVDGVAVALVVRDSNGAPVFTSDHVIDLAAGAIDDGRPGTVARVNVDSDAWDIAGAQAGSYTVEVTVDPNNEVAEFYTGDNTAATAFVIS